MSGIEVSDSLKAYLALSNRAIEWKRRAAEWKDATEFEARVAKLLSEPGTIERLLDCWNWPVKKLRCDEDKDADCRRCRIKVARLIAEEEMDR